MVLLQSEYKKLKRGDPAPDFKLKGIDGRMYPLGDMNKPALLIIFMCNHCPYVKPKMHYFKQLQARYGDNGLQIVGINSNDPADYPEDSWEGMKKTAMEEGFNFLYLVDETQEVAKAYGAVCTPDPFLFNEQRRLVYHGRFDNAHKLPHERATTQEMEDAIKQLLAGEKIEVPTLPSMGCSIKWTANRPLAAQK